MRAHSSTAHTEYFHVVSTKPSGPGTIIVTGVVNAGGTEKPGRAIDGATFPGGSFRIDHSAGQPTARFDAATCVGTITQTGPFEVIDATGDMGGLAGSGRYVFQALYTTARVAGHCSSTDGLHRNHRRGSHGQGLTGLRPSSTSVLVSSRGRVVRELPDHPAGQRDAMGRPVPAPAAARRGIGHQLRMQELRVLGSGDDQQLGVADRDRRAQLMRGVLQEPPLGGQQPGVLRAWSARENGLVR
jgi:hypothetical protein